MTRLAIGGVLSADELRRPLELLGAVADDLLERLADLGVIVVDDLLDGGVFLVCVGQEDLVVDDAGHFSVVNDHVDLVEGLRRACWG